MVFKVNVKIYIRNLYMETKSIIKWMVWQLFSLHVIWESDKLKIYLHSFLHYIFIILTCIYKKKVLLIYSLGNWRRINGLLEILYSVICRWHSHYGWICLWFSTCIEWIWGLLLTVEIECKCWKNKTYNFFKGSNAEE